MSGFSREAKRLWLALVRTPQVGSRTALKLLQALGSPEAIFAASAETLARLGLKKVSIEYIQLPDWGQVDRDLDWAESHDCRIVSISDPVYPALLKEIADPPAVLFVRGNLTLLSTPQLAMVGSRNPSPVGKQTAHDFARYLAHAGLTITSGLALGIDAMSHQGALDADGVTVAVTGTGLDRVYPARHKALAERILEQGGALVSEFPPGIRAIASNFPRRNRIISGLSIGTLVVEAAVSSGSLITARLTLEQGREVFAVPGSIHNPLSRGCNALIKQGAKLVETAEDIVEELQQFAGQEKITLDEEITEEVELNDALHHNLLNSIGYEPVTVDVLVSETGMRVEEISSMLLVLELEGVVSSAPGGTYYRLK